MGGDACRGSLDADTLKQGMYDGSDTIVLYDELAYDDVLPVMWKPLPQDFDASAAAGLLERNLRLLQACAAIEEHGALDKQDDKSPNAADILRIDLKVNLVLDLLGQILTSMQPRPPVQPIRFNAKGAIWRPVAGAPATGSVGLMEIYLRDSVPQPLTLVADVATVERNGEVTVQFRTPGETVADLIQKLAFRRHRRLVAGTRQPRRS